MPVLLPVDPEHEIHQVVQRVIQEQYDYLTGLDPQLDLRVLWAHTTKEGEPALKKNGEPIVSCIETIKYNRRVLGAGDVVLIVDEAEWNDLLPRQQEAEIAERIQSLDFPGLRMGENNVWVPVLDMAERPMVNIKRGDIRISGFSRVAERYGDDSPLRIAMAIARERLRQEPLPFMKAPADRTLVAAGLPKDTTISFNGRKLETESDLADALEPTIAKIRKSRKQDVDEMFLDQTA